MEITMTLTLKMTDEQLHAWAGVYGLSMDEVASDASGHLGAMVKEHVANMPHVKNFAPLAKFTVK